MSLSPKRVVLSYIKASADAEIPVGLSDQDERKLNMWDRGRNPYIDKINRNIKSNPERPLQGLTTKHKEELLAWAIHTIQNMSNPPTDAPTTESTEELLESDGSTFKSEKDLDKHLVKQLSRMPDNGLDKPLVFNDKNKVVVEKDEK